MITVARTREVGMTPRSMGEARSLFRKPNRRSQTMDMPENMQVNSVTMESMPTAR